MTNSLSCRYNNENKVTRARGRCHLEITIINAKYCLAGAIVAVAETLDYTTSF